jgi:hypothetical protein
VDRIPQSELQTLIQAPPATAHERAHANNALAGNVAELNSKLPGSGRNAALNGIAYRMGRMISAGWIEQTMVETALIGSSRQNGYALKDGLEAILKTIQSGIRKGMESPHEPLPEEIVLEGVREFAKQGQAWFGSLIKTSDASTSLRARASVPK